MLSHHPSRDSGLSRIKISAGIGLAARISVITVHCCLGAIRWHWHAVAVVILLKKMDWRPSESSGCPQSTRCPLGAVNTSGECVRELGFER